MSGARIVYLHSFEDSVTWSRWGSHKGDTVYIGGVGSMVTNEPAVLMPHCSGSGYSGNLVERSNYEHVLENFADSEGVDWCRTHGGHGTYGILARVDEATGEIANDDLRGLAESLESYPLADESRHSEMEWAARSEAWESWGRSEFERELRRLEPVDAFVGELSDEDLDTLFFAVESCGAGIEWVNEQGDSMHIDVAQTVGIAFDLRGDHLQYVDGYYKAPLDFARAVMAQARIEASGAHPDVVRDAQIAISVDGDCKTFWKRLERES